MKTLVISAATAVLFMGCATTDNDLASSSTGQTAVDNQPQTAIAGEGSLMPGADGSRGMQSGQFTGRERTNGQVGSQPTLPREAAIGSPAGAATGTGASTPINSVSRPE